MRHGFVWVVTVAVLTVGCETTGSEPEECAEADVSLTVSTGLQPTFTWTPECRMTWLQVSNAVSADVMWSLSADGNRIPSGVRYGTVPPGSEEWEPAAPLNLADRYTLAIWRYACDRPRAPPDCLVLADSVTFRP